MSREEFLIKDGWEKLYITDYYYIFMKGNYRINYNGFIFKGMEFIGHFDEDYGKL